MSIPQDLHDRITKRLTPFHVVTPAGQRIDFPGLRDSLVRQVFDELEAAGWLLISPEQQAGAIEIEASEMCLCECPCEEDAG